MICFLRRLNSSHLVNKLNYSKIMNAVVEISEGKIQGKTCMTSNHVEYYAFKSIPYAKPPIGDLRFAAPQCPEKWEGIRNATQDCNISLQYDTKTDSVKGSEDCLYLNVFTPKLPDDSTKPYPVMFYIHGGGFATGNGTKENDQQGPDYIIEKNIVYVGINYRLGIFGFLSLNRKEVTGNMGLRDQVQALKWVQKNIRKFNGDPDNVTVFGISAGGASVEYLLLSPMTNELFHKAIAQSGSSLLHWACNIDIENLANKIAAIDGENIPNKDKLYEYLKSVPAEKLMVSSMTVKSESNKGGINFIYVPTIEKPEGKWEPFIDELPYNILSTKKFAEVPFISGFCSRESLLMTVSHPDAIKRLVKTQNFLEFLPFDLDENDKISINDLLKKLYIEDKICEHEDDFAIDFFTDIDFLGGIFVSACLIANKSSCSYFYEFDYSGGYNYMKRKLGINRKGACHADDKGHILKCSVTLSSSDTDEVVRERIVIMWTNFAKFGNPTPNTNSTVTTLWNPASSRSTTNEDVAYLRIDDKLTMCDKIKPEIMKLYLSLYSKYNVCK